MFYTPGWGAVLTLTGTLSGASITQLANTVKSRNETLKERDLRLKGAVSDLIASANARISAAGTYEWDMRKLVEKGATSAERDKLSDIKEDALVSALLEMRRHAARIQVTGPKVVYNAVRSLSAAIGDIEGSVKSTVALVQEQNSMEHFHPTEGREATRLIEELVAATKKATDHRYTFAKAKSLFRTAR
jgi:hypothetical protein